MPVISAVGHSLIGGHWPALTLQMQNGGALLAEYQYGLLNPVSLASYAAITQIRDLSLAAAALAIFHLSMLSCGTYVLATSCSASRPDSLAAACAFSTSNFIYYWFSSSWFPGLVSLAWFVWAAAFLIRADGSRGHWIAGVGFVFLTVTSGWPQTDLVLALVAVAAAWVHWRTAGPRAAVGVAVTMAVGCLIAAPAIFPLLGTTPIAARQSGIENSNNLAVDLYSLLAVSSPFHFGHFVLWGKEDVIKNPLFFAGWYLLPVLPLLAWTRLNRPSALITALGGVALVLLVAIQGPELLGPVRLPFRYIPFLHLVLLLLFAAVVSETGLSPPTKKTIFASLAVVAFAFLAATQVQPGFWFLSLAGSGLVAVFTLLIARSANLAPWGRSGAMILGTLAIFAITRALFPANLNQPDWGLKSSERSLAPLDEVPKSYSFYLGPVQVFKDGDPGVPLFGAMPLLVGQPTVSGYSPIGQGGFKKALCVETHGAVCADAGEHLLTRTKALPALADLLRIDRIVAYRGHGFPAEFESVLRHPDWLSIDDRGLPVAAEELLDKDWQLVTEDRLTRTYARRKPVRWPSGSLAWTSPGLTAATVGIPRAREERIAISARSGSRDEIIFSRLAWPGYRATFGGRPARIAVRDDFLLAIELPEGRQIGTLTLRYDPPLLGPGLFAAFAGALIALVGLFGRARQALWGRGRPAPFPDLTGPKSDPAPVSMAQGQ